MPPNCLAPFLRVLGDEVVTIYIGEKRKKFIIHSNLLKDLSLKVDEMLIKMNIEGTAELYFHNEKADVFEKFLLWLYRGTISNFELGKNDAEEMEMWWSLCDLIVFAESLEINGLANMTIDRLHDYLHRTKMIPIGAIPTKTMSERTSNTSSLRRFLVSVHIWLLSAANERVLAGLTRICKANDEFLRLFIELLPKYVDSAPGSGHPDFRKRGVSNGGFHTCYFHVHVRGEKCHLTRVDRPIKLVEGNEEVASQATVKGKAAAKSGPAHA